MNARMLGLVVVIRLMGESQRSVSLKFRFSRTVKAPPTFLAVGESPVKQVLWLKSFSVAAANKLGIEHHPLRCDFPGSIRKEAQKVISGLDLTKIFL